MAEQVIVNTPDYILTVEVLATPRSEELITIRRYVEGLGWAKLELYLTDQQYEDFCEAITINTAANSRMR